jgi:hypothetical protein
MPALSIWKRKRATREARSAERAARRAADGCLDRRRGENVYHAVEVTGLRQRDSETVVDKIKRSDCRTKANAH